jgi:hypothetical protein
MTGSKMRVWLKVTLVVVGLLLTAVPLSVDAQQPYNTATTSTDKSLGNGQYETTSGLVYHLAGQKDIALMKARDGVRNPAQDYNVIINGHGTGLTPPTEEGYSSIFRNM